MAAPRHAEIARALEPYDIYWIEDPMPATAFPESWADLRSTSASVPRSRGSETMASRAAFRAFMEAGALDVVIMDLGWCGGLTEAKAIASMADAFHLPIAPHDCTGPLAWAACTNLTINAPERPGAGKRAGLLHRLVQRTGHQPARHGRRPDLAARGHRHDRRAETGGLQEGGCCGETDGGVRASARGRGVKSLI